jgi:hypothetical protein
MAHWTNLAVQILFDQPLVAKLERLLQKTSTSFSSSHKQHSEYCAFIKWLETKGLKLLRNVKTRWISMLSFTKWVFVDIYKTLTMRMNDDLNIVATTKTNLVYLFDIELVMGLTYILPMLEVVHVLIKFAQSQ